MWLNRWGSDGELNLATALSHSSVFCFQIRRRTFRDDPQKPDILSSAWLHKHLAHALTVHYVEYERQHRAAGGGVWDVHGVFPNVEPQRALVQHRLVLQQIIQSDDATWNQHRGVREDFKLANNTQSNDCY